MEPTRSARRGIAGFGPGLSPPYTPLLTDKAWQGQPGGAFSTRFDARRNHGSRGQCLGVGCRLVRRLQASPRPSGRFVELQFDVPPGLGPLQGPTWPQVRRHRVPLCSGSVPLILFSLFPLAAEPFEFFLAPRYPPRPSFAFATTGPGDAFVFDAACMTAASGARPGTGQFPFAPTGGGRNGRLQIVKQRGGNLATAQTRFRRKRCNSPNESVL